jgi:hypothetical protein
MTGVIAAEADGQLTLGSGVSWFATGVAEGGGLAVARFVVVPTAGLAVQVGFGRRWRRGKVFAEFGVMVEGFFSRGVVVVIPSLPLHLYDDPFKCVSSGQVLHQFLAVLLCLIQLIIRLLDKEVELSLPQLQVPVLVDSSDEGRVGLVLNSLVNPLLEGLVRAEEGPLLAGERSVGEENRSGTKEARVDRLSFA